MTAAQVLADAGVLGTTTAATDDPIEMLRTIADTANGAAQKAALEASRREIWVKAYLAALKNPQQISGHVHIADHALAEFDKRFSK